MLGQNILCPFISLSKHTDAVLPPLLLSRVPRSQRTYIQCTSKVHKCMRGIEKMTAMANG